jgi:hypothetical protein
MSNSDYRIVVRISNDDDAWLSSESERIGCDKATLVRMMIRKGRLAGAFAPGNPAELPPLMPVYGTAEPSAPQPADPYRGSAAEQAAPPPQAADFPPSPTVAEPLGPHAEVEYPPEISPAERESEAMRDRRLAELIAKGAPPMAPMGQNLGTPAPPGAAIPLTAPFKEGPYERGRRWSGRG